MNPELLAAIRNKKDQKLDKDNVSKQLVSKRLGQATDTNKENRLRSYKNGSPKIHEIYGKESPDSYKTGYYKTDFSKGVSSNKEEAIIRRRRAGETTMMGPNSCSNQNGHLSKVQSYVKDQNPDIGFFRMPTESNFGVDIFNEENSGSVKKDDGFNEYNYSDMEDSESEGDDNDNLVMVEQEKRNSISISGFKKNFSVLETRTVKVKPGYNVESKESQKPRDIPLPPKTKNAFYDKNKDQINTGVKKSVSNHSDLKTGVSDKFSTKDERFSSNRRVNDSSSTDPLENKLSKASSSLEAKKIEQLYAYMKKDCFKQKQRHQSKSERDNRNPVKKQPLSQKSTKTQHAETKNGNPEKVSFKSDDKVPYYENPMIVDTRFESKRNADPAHLYSDVDTSTDSIDDNCTLVLDGNADQKVQLSEKKIEPDNKNSTEDHLSENIKELIDENGIFHQTNLTDVMKEFVKDWLGQARLRLEARKEKERSKIDSKV